MAIKVKNTIKHLIEDKQISVMLDIGEKNRSIFGINIQFIHNNQLEIASIVMLQTKNSHTAVNLKDLVLERITQNIIGVRCAAHILQLAVKDAL